MNRNVVSGLGAIIIVCSFLVLLGAMLGESNARPAFLALSMALLTIGISFIAIARHGGMSSNPSPATVEFRNLSKVFGDVTAVREVSFDVNAGRVVGLHGRNGAGNGRRFEVGIADTESAQSLHLRQNANLTWVL